MKTRIKYYIYTTLFRMLNKWYPIIIGRCGNRNYLFVYHFLKRNYPKKFFIKNIAKRSGVEYAEIMYIPKEILIITYMDLIGYVEPNLSDKDIEKLIKEAEAMLE